jgi:magnesium chelatase subunit I
MTLAKTLGELRESGYKSEPVKAEMRRNLIEKIRNRENLFPGIVGYEDTVIPQVENAILSGQDIIFLGERGQAKSRIARSLISLLDEWIPTVTGSEINDDPFDPISAHARQVIEEQGDRTPIEWVHRD